MRIPTSAVSPSDALARVAEAVPPDVRGNIIVIGSLAAGYQLLRDQPDYEVRTKDVDCVIAPRIAAVEKGAELAATLIAQWLDSTPRRGPLESRKREYPNRRASGGPPVPA